MKEYLCRVFWYSSLIISRTRLQLVLFLEHVNQQAANKCMPAAHMCKPLHHVC